MIEAFGRTPGAPYKLVLSPDIAGYLLPFQPLLFSGTSMAAIESQCLSSLNAGEQYKDSSSYEELGSLHYSLTLNRLADSVLSSSVLSPLFGQARLQTYSPLLLLSSFRFYLPLQYRVAFIKRQ